MYLPSSPIICFRNTTLIFSNSTRYLSLVCVRFLSELTEYKRYLILFFQLENPGVKVTSVRIDSSDGANNELRTFWMSSDVDLSRGLDFSNRGPVYARFSHLNHRDFQYKYVINSLKKWYPVTINGASILFPVSPTETFVCVLAFEPKTSHCISHTTRVNTLPRRHF